MGEKSRIGKGTGFPWLRVRETVTVPSFCRMTSRLKSPTDGAGGKSRSPAPDWDQVPFDVACARCGGDLRGLTEPTCPACGLEFEWSEAVPIEELTCLHCGYHLYGLRETRCPECGSPFTWEHVLDVYRRRNKPFFEYRWGRRPIRAFVRTWFWALRPGKLWGKFEIQDPPQPIPLLVLAVMGLMALVVSFSVLAGLQRWLSIWYGMRKARPGSWGPGWFDLPRFIFDAFTDSAPTLALLATLWVVTSFAALMVFRQSMWRWKVRTVHVLRVWAHAVPLMLVTVVLGVAMLSYLSIFWRSSHWEIAMELVLVMLPVHVIWSLRCGYRRYLRMPHALAVAVASQLMAMLATITIYDMIGPGGLGASILIEIDRHIGFL